MAEAEATALPVAGSSAPLPSLAALTQADEPLQSPWALPTEVMSLTAPDPDEQLQIDSWCQSELVALPSDALPASDGSMMPLTENDWVAHSGVSRVFGETRGPLEPRVAVVVLRSLDVILDMRGNQAPHTQPEGISNAQNIARV